MSIKLTILEKVVIHSWITVHGYDKDYFQCNTQAKEVTETISKWIKFKTWKYGNGSKIPIVINVSTKIPSRYWFVGRPSPLRCDALVRLLFCNKQTCNKCNKPINKVNQIGTRPHTEWNSFHVDLLFSEFSLNFNFQLRNKVNLQIYL